MAKGKTKVTYTCKECGHTVSKWQGKCNKCHAWNSFEESVQTTRPGTKTVANVPTLNPILLTNIDLKEGEIRLRSGIGELDRVLGGGLVAGSLSLIGGDPGVGKSTLLDALGMLLIEKGHSVAILAVDPSSNMGGGSILGDKTRMHQLSHEPNAYIRPSASGTNLG